MAIEPKKNTFDTPVPGQSLTDTPKNGAWENQPRFTNSEKAAQGVWSKLHKKETASTIIIVLEAGDAVEALTKIIVFAG